MNLLAFLQKPKQPLTASTSSSFFGLESALELHVRNMFFPSDQYALLERRLLTSRLSDDRQPYMCPAFKFFDQRTRKEFWLEAKSCSPDWSHHIHWCTEVELRRYLSCHKKTPTFLLLDIDHGTSYSHSYYLLSMTQASHAHLLDSCIAHFEIPANQPISSPHLWSR